LVQEVFGGFLRSWFFEVFLAKATPTLATFEPQNGDLKFFFKFWEENLQD
jgi:hypothetical protein